jgi:hypothetical protein
MAIMSAAVFKKRSDHLFSRRRNPLIKDIDKLLELYVDPGNGLNRKLKILVTLYCWCKLYLQTGGKKSGTVTELLAQVKEELEKPVSTFTLEARHQGLRDDKVLTGKGIDKPYHVESVLPKGQVGGVQLQHQQKRVNAVFVKDLAIDEALAYVSNGKPYKGVDPMWDANKIGDYLMNNMSLTDQLDLLTSAFGSDAYEAQARFEYCNERERKKYQVHMWDGYFYQDEEHTRHFSHVAPPGANPTCMYAMDENERLFVKPTVDVVTAGNGSFNHSSFTAGKPVICAGELKIVGGQLTHIDNKSGHYKPTTGDLVEIIRVLNTEYAVDFSQVTIYDQGGAKQHLPAVPWYNQNFGAKPSR